MENKLEYYIYKIEKQLDFHRGLHLFEMEMNPNFTNKVVFLKESQEQYITNLFGNNKNIQESYNREFNNSVIVESTFDPKDEVKKFFSFIKENYFNEVRKSDLLSEQKKPGVFDKIKTIITKNINVAKQKREQALAKMTPEQKTAFLKKEAEIKVKNDKSAYTVVAALKKAFDTDNDNVFDDWDGTYEDQAVKAIKLITNKNVLDKVNQIIAASIKPYKNLKQWVNAEMSDFDPTEYRAIWKRLESLGYVGANYNQFLAAAGTGVDLVQKGFKWLKEKGLPWFFEKLREALGSTVGAVLQQLLDYTGIGAIGVSILWGVLTIFDTSQLASGIGSWAKLFFSVIGLLTAGALAKTVGGFLKPFFSSTGGKLSSFFASIAEKPWFVKYIKPITGWIGSKIGQASSLLTQAGEWVVKKLGATTVGGYVSKAAQWLRSIAEGIVKWAGAGAKAETQTLAKAEVQTGAQKLIDKTIKDKAKKYGKEKVAQGAGYIGGEKAKTAVELGYDVSDLSKDRKTFAKDLSQAKFDKAVKSGQKVYKNVSGVVDKAQQIAGINQPKKNQNLG
jgi:hypothetical protein